MHSTQPKHVDAIIIGGGFYGVAIAVYLAEKRGLKNILLIEQEAELLRHASYHNQARVHNGYHYPRSYTTAFRSRVNMPKFMRDWPDVIKKDFTALYAIAKRNSKVTPRQFERFCDQIGAKIQPAQPAHQKLFNPSLIDKVYQVEEYAFDADRLRLWAIKSLKEASIEVRLETTAKKIFSCDNQNIGVVIESKQGTGQTLHARYVFNCTYSGLKQIQADSAPVQTPLKHEIAEMLLMKMPPSLDGVSITTMDGPFFSIFPFPSRGLHTVSHVRYTPHCPWNDCADINPYHRLQSDSKITMQNRMIRDISRYIPDIAKAHYKESLFEVKTVLVKNEGDDGRPILYEKPLSYCGYYAILGGKIDNIYDVWEKLDAEQFD